MFRFGVSFGRHDITVEDHLQVGYNIMNIKTIKNNGIVNVLKSSENVSSHEVFFSERQMICQDNIGCTNCLSSVYFYPKLSDSSGGDEPFNWDGKKKGKYQLSSKQPLDWVMKQEAYTSHKQIQRNFTRNRVYVGVID